MGNKLVYKVNAKILHPDNSKAVWYFYVEAATEGKAETKLEEWLKGGNSKLKIKEILSVRVIDSIYVVA